MPSEKEILIEQIKKIQKIMKEGEEIPLVNIEDSNDKNYEIATYLTKEKIGCVRLPKKDSTGFYTFDKRSSFSEIGYNEFAQAVIALDKKLPVVSMLSQYLSVKRFGRTWPFGTHEESNEAHGQI